MELAHRKCLYRIWHLYTFIICNIWRKHIIAIPAMFGDDTPPGVLLMPSRASVAHGKKVLQCHEESLITVSCGSSSIQRARGSCITVRILQAMLLSRPDWRRAKRTQRVSGSPNHPPNCERWSCTFLRISHCRNTGIAYIRVHWTISVE